MRFPSMALGRCLGNIPLISFSPTYPRTANPAAVFLWGPLKKWPHDRGKYHCYLTNIISYTPAYPLQAFLWFTCLSPIPPPALTAWQSLSPSPRPYQINMVSFYPPSYTSYSRTFLPNLHFHMHLPQASKSSASLTLWLTPALSPPISHHSNHYDHMH